MRFSINLTIEEVDLLIDALWCSEHENLASPGETKRIKNQLRYIAKNSGYSHVESLGLILRQLNLTHYNHDFSYELYDAI